MAFVLMVFAGLLVLGVIGLTVAWVHAKLESYRKEIKELKTKLRAAEVNADYRTRMMDEAMEEVHNAPAGDVTAQLIEGRISKFRQREMEKI